MNQADLLSVMYIPALFPPLGVRLIVSVPVPPDCVQLLARNSDADFATSGHPCYRRAVGDSPFVVLLFSVGTMQLFRKPLPLR